MGREFKTVINNGITIPNECDCIWCGGTMKSGGAKYFGAGVNQFSLWCENCGAVVIHAKDSSKRKIDGFSIKYNFENNTI